jgi:outer membrane receptor protein involved in Fe transport
LSGEVQYIYRSKYFNLTAGAGYVDIDGKINGIMLYAFPPPDNVFRSRASMDLKHTNVYAYSYLKPLNDLMLTLGASGDFTDGDSPDVAKKNKFNPKFGVTWNPFPNTTFRAAAFRVLKRTLVTNQTLEPTQVAGFNQFFDDANGTEAWRYGGALDQKFSKNIHGGLEFSWRDLKVSTVDFGNETKFDWKDSLGRAYLFWTPHPWWALRVEYQYERVKRDNGLTDGIKELNTHRVPLGVNFFHPSGLSASVIGTFHNQDGEFDRITGLLYRQAGNDNFWLVDAGISYRLPRRLGLITVGVKNLFDKSFKYYNTDFANPGIQPERFFFATLTLALP